MPKIFDYLDYRKYLKDAYAEDKAAHPNRTHRYIEGKLGLKSAGHFAQILGGRCNISALVAGRLSAYLRLKRREADYFEALVNYNQAKTHEEKNRHFGRLMSFKKGRAQIVGQDRHAFYRTWYFSAVRELLDLHPFKGDHAALGRMLSPALAPEQAREAIDLLLRLGFIVRRADGSLAKAEAVVTSGYPVESEALRAYQLEVLELTRQAVDRFPKELRNFSTLTVTLSADDYRLLLEELRAFRGRILEMARQSQVPDRVYQCNFQLFPLALPQEKPV